MRLMKKRIMAVLFGMSISACSSTPPFPYKFYYLDFPGHNLIGNIPENDIDVQVCDDYRKSFEHKCVVMMKEDFMKMYSEYTETIEKLIESQKK